MNQISKLVKWVGAAIVAVTFLAAAPAALATAPGTVGPDVTPGEVAMAEATTPQMVVIPNVGLKMVGIGIGLGLVIMGVGKGIGNIGSSAVESMARQPEVAGNISGAMILTAAMIEGATLFGVVVLFIAVFIGN